MATGGLESVQGWNEGRESRVKELEDENKKLKDKNRELRMRLFLLEFNSTKTINEKKEQIKKLHEKIDKLQSKANENEKEKRRLMKIIERLLEEKKHLIEENERYQEIIKIAQLEGKICNHSCVLDTLLWICEKKLPTLNIKGSCDVDCRRKLEKVLIFDAHEKIDKDYLDCDRLMDILEKSGIVKEEGRFVFHPKYCEDPYSEMNEVWEKIIKKKMNKIDNVLILGRKQYTDKFIGHVVVCDLDVMPDDVIRVDIHDPQQVLKQEVDGESFKTYLKDDIALMLFSINLEMFGKILKKYYPEEEERTSGSHGTVKDVTETLNKQLSMKDLD